MIILHCVWVPYSAYTVLWVTPPLLCIYSHPSFLFSRFYFPPSSSIHHILSGVLVTPLSMPRLLFLWFLWFCDSQCFTLFDLRFTTKRKNLQLFNPPIDRMGHRHNRRLSRLRPNRIYNIDTINSPIDSDPFSRSLAPTWHYGSLNWTCDHPPRFETERCWLFGGEPGDDVGLCYRMLEYFGGLDYVDS